MNRMRKPQPLYDTPPKDSFEEFFDGLEGGGGASGSTDGSDTPSVDDKKTAAAGDTAYNFPDAEWVPPAIRGKNVKEAAEIMKKNEGEFTKLNTSFKEATTMLDKIKAGASSAPPTADIALQDITVNALLEMRIDKVMETNPELAPFRDEVMGLLSNIADPRIRMMPDAMALVMNQIKGNHHKEILDAAIKKATTTILPTSLEGTAFGGTPPRAPSVDLSKIGKEGQANLALWFEGDIQKAKENLLPPKEQS